MTPELLVILFVFGLLIGSFLNVLALRYDGEHNVFDPKMIGGRSHCPHCKHTLRWYELIPVVSYVVQGARCRNCKARIGFQYPLVELISACIFAFVPLRLISFYGPGALPTQGAYLLAALWVAAFEILLLISYIDIRLEIVPDELNVVLGLVALMIGVLSAGYSNGANLSFFGGYAGVLGLQINFWLAHFAGAIIGGAFFFLLVVVTPYLFGKEGMGMGDVKLALPLGFLFGWPDIVLLYGVAFVVGAIVGVALIINKKRTKQGVVPFVPFIAFGSFFVFFFGLGAIDWYFRIIGL